MANNPTGYYDKAAIRARVEKLTREREDAQRRAVQRDPCYNCAVPADRHDDQGCAQYRVQRYG